MWGELLSYLKHFSTPIWILSYCRRFWYLLSKSTHGDSLAGCSYRVAIVIVEDSEAAEAAVRELNGHRMHKHTFHIRRLSGAAGEDRPSVSTHVSKSVQDVATAPTSDTEWRFADKMVRISFLPSCVDPLQLHCRRCMKTNTFWTCKAGNAGHKVLILYQDKLLVVVSWLKDWGSLIVDLLNLQTHGNAGEG